MEAVVCIVMLVIMALPFIFMGMLSSKAKKLLTLLFEVPDGKKLSQVHEDIIRSLPSGWSPAGSKGRTRWNAEDKQNGNFLNLETGLLGGLAISVDLSTAFEDDNGFLQEVSFQDVPPQDAYIATIWMSYRHGGLGKMLNPLQAMKIINLHKYLCSKFGADYENDAEVEKEKHVY